MLGKLYPFQETSLTKIYEFGGRALLGFQMGLGKSCTSLAWMEEAVLHLSGIVVIGCPSMLRFNWRNELKQHFNLPCTVIEGRTPPFQERDLPDGIYIISYDSLGSNPEANNWLRLLLWQKINLVIGDEIQLVSNASAKRTKGFLELGKSAQFRLALSGTPITNYVAGLYPILMFLGLHKYFPSETQFLHRYCDPVLKPWGWEFNGATNVEELHRLLTKTCLIRYLKEDVAKELPSKTRTVIPLDLQNRKEYDKAESDFAGWLGDKHPERMIAALKAERLVKIGYLKRLAAKLKTKQGIAWLTHLLSMSKTSKVICFAVHKEQIAALKAAFPDISVVVDGATPNKVREANISKFRTDKGCRLLIGNIIAAGTGWNGEMANYVVFFEMAWTPAAHLQAEDRAHRLTSKNNLTVYFLVAQGTMEEDLCELVQDKHYNASSVIDGKAFTRFDIFDQLQLRIQEKHGRRTTTKRAT